MKRLLGAKRIQLNPVGRETSFDFAHNQDQNSSRGEQSSPDLISSLKIEVWMTTGEAANFLRISRASLLNLSSNGKVPYYKFQRRNRYLKSDLSKLLLSTKKGVFDWALKK